MAETDARQGHSWLQRSMTSLPFNHKLPAFADPNNSGRALRARNLTGRQESMRRREHALPHRQLLPLAGQDAVPDLVEDNFLCRYLLAYNSLMTGDLSE